MSLQLRRSYSFLAPSVLLVAILMSVQPGQTAPLPHQGAQESDGTCTSRHQLKAEQDDPAAQYNLARCYLRRDPNDGREPTSEDYQTALKWLNASKSHNHAAAEFLLGYLYEHGQGVARDYGKAAENYRAAALQGHSTAENNLASLYQHGQGVPRNMSQAFEWYLASAQHGNSVGQCNLATLYYLGAGVPRDYKEAARWFRAAADAGSAEAQNSLAVSYYKGLGVELDYGEAARWLQLASNRGLPGAQTNLAYLYEQGIGVTLNYTEAYAWYSRAIAAGDSSGAERRKELAHLMTRKQLDEASALLSVSASYPQQQAPAGTGAFSLLQNH